MVGRKDVVADPVVLRTLQAQPAADGARRIRQERVALDRICPKVDVHPAAVTLRLVGHNLVFLHHTRARLQIDPAADTRTVVRDRVTDNLPPCLKSQIDAPATTVACPRPRRRIGENLVLAHRGGAIAIHVHSAAVEDIPSPRSIQRVRVDAISRYLRVAILQVHSAAACIVLASGDVSLERIAGENRGVAAAQVHTAAAAIPTVLCVEGVGSDGIACQRDAAFLNIESAAVQPRSIGADVITAQDGAIAAPHIDAAAAGLVLACSRSRVASNRIIDHLSRAFVQVQPAALAQGGVGEDLVPRYHSGIGDQVKAAAAMPGVVLLNEIAAQRCIAMVQVDAAAHLIGMVSGDGIARHRRRAAGNDDPAAPTRVVSRDQIAAYRRRRIADERDAAAAADRLIGTDRIVRELRRAPSCAGAAPIPRFVSGDEVSVHDCVAESQGNPAAITGLVGKHAAVI
ncbi:MAG: hypothetical protein BWY76_01746 [bacterium ADurb.Bin429]|nr:MAG: hypothetical protein BWY76_01746 [bacterium ADurb.Bin429]